MMIAQVLLLVTMFTIGVSSEALCQKAQCPSEYVCSLTSHLCEHPNGDKWELIGHCVNELCPGSYKCVDGACLRKPRQRLAGSTAIGPCVNLHCPGDHMCHYEDNQCYPEDKGVEEKVDDKKFYRGFRLL